MDYIKKIISLQPKQTSQMPPHITKSKEQNGIMPLPQQIKPNPKITNSNHCNAHRE